MVFASFAGPFAITDAQAAVAVPPITVDKEVVGADWVDKDLGIAQVKLTVNSQDIDTTVTTPLTTRIVLVLDYSGSMDDDGKVTELKNKAKEFVDQMLAIQGDIQIAVVTFNNTATSNPFSSNATTLKNKIQATSTGGGTNIQDGINKGQTLLNTVIADNKIMVVLSDGEPNRSYKGTAGGPFTPADTALNYDGVTWPTVITAFDYSNVLNANYNYTLPKKGTDRRYQIGSAWITNHGFGTVSEALLAKKAGTTIYSVGFDMSAGSTAAKVMKSVASSNSKFFMASDDLTVAFDTIGTSIVEQAAGEGAVVTDQMGYNTDMSGGNNYEFKALIDASHPVVHTEPAGVTSSATYDASTETFNWVLTSGDIEEGTYTLTYYVQIQDINGNGVGDNVTDVLTNHQAVLNYIDAAGAPQSISFEDPTLQVEHYTVEYYFDGTLYSTLTTTQAAIAGRTPVTVTAPLFPGFDYDTTVYGNDVANTALDIVQGGEDNVIKIYYTDIPELPGTWTPDVTKELTGKIIEEDMFQFTITQVFESDARNAVYSETKWNIGPMIPFSSIVFTEPGTYVYDISEIDGNVPGFTYDTDVIRVTVVVTEDDNNNLVARASYDGGQVFNNSYVGPGSITVTKNMIVLTDDPAVAVNYTFYAALFEKEEDGMVKVSDVKALNVVGSASTTAFFDNLDLNKTYYVYETDAAGNIIQTAADGTITTPIIPDWIKINYEGNQVTLSSDGMRGSATITNTFDPEDLPLQGEGTIRVNKTVMVDDKPFASNRTFYVALFTDKELKNLASEVKAIKMNGTATAFVTFDKDKLGEPLFVEDTYYVAETDINGVPLVGTVETLGFEISIDNAKVVIVKEGSTVNIINKFKSEEFPLTGDNSNMSLWLFLAMLGVAGAIAPFAFRKKEVAND
jgi:pilin isopeptide linkage protein